jgi:hypothetical protein
MFVAALFQREDMGAATALRSLWTLCILCHCSVLSNIYTSYIDWLLDCWSAVGPRQHGPGPTRHMTLFYFQAALWAFRSHGRSVCLLIHKWFRQGFNELQQEAPHISSVPCKYNEYQWDVHMFGSWPEGSITFYPLRTVWIPDVRRSRGISCGQYGCRNGRNVVSRLFRYSSAMSYRTWGTFRLISQGVGLIQISLGLMCLLIKVSFILINLGFFI